MGINEQGTIEDSTPDETVTLIKSPPRERNLYDTLSKSAMYEEDKKIAFDDLDPATSYTIRVNTVMNGIEIASKEAKIYQMGL